MKHYLQISAATDGSRRCDDWLPHPDAVDGVRLVRCYRLRSSPDSVSPVLVEVLRSLDPSAGFPQVRCLSTAARAPLHHRASPPVRAAHLESASDVPRGEVPAPRMLRERNDLHVALLIEDELVVVIFERREQRAVLVIRRDVVEDLQPHRHGDDGAIQGVDVVALDEEGLLFLPLGVTFPAVEHELVVLRDADVVVHRTECHLVAPRTELGEKRAPGAGRELGHEHGVHLDSQDVGVEWVLPPLELRLVDGAAPPRKHLRDVERARGNHGRTIPLELGQEVFHPFVALDVALARQRIVDVLHRGHVVLRRGIAIPASVHGHAAVLRVGVIHLLVRRGHERQELHERVEVGGLRHPEIGVPLRRRLQRGSHRAQTNLLVVRLGQHELDEVFERGARAIVLRLGLARRAAVRHRFELPGVRIRGD